MTSAEVVIICAVNMCESSQNGFSMFPPLAGVKKNMSSREPLKIVNHLYSNGSKKRGPKTRYYIEGAMSIDVIQNHLKNHFVTDMTSMKTNDPIEPQKKSLLLSIILVVL